MMSQGHWMLVWETLSLVDYNHILLLLFFFFFCFFFFLPKLCPDEFSVTTGRIVLKFGDMLDMDVKLCNRVSKFKMSDSKAGPQAFPKLPKFCRDYFLLTTGRIVLKFGDMLDMDVKLCNRVSKFKMSDSKAGPQAFPKLPKFCRDYFLLTTEGIVLIFFLVY